MLTTDTETNLCSILGKSVNFRVLVTFFHCKSDYYILHALWLLLATSSKGGAANGQVFVAFKPYGNFYSGVQMNWTQHSGAISERYHSGWKQAYRYIKSIYVTIIPIRISLVGMQKWRSTIGMMIDTSENEFKNLISFEEHCRLKYWYLKCILHSLPPHTLQP